MGGWCTERRSCGRYHFEGGARQYATERACPRTNTVFFIPVAAAANAQASAA
jgi:hypothetical protein